VIEKISKRRIRFILAGITLIFFLLNIRTAYVALIWGGELSVITDRQYTITEPISNIKYSLQDNTGKELLNYNIKYYFVVDINTFIKNNKDTDISELKAVTYLLRNFNKDYDLTALRPESVNQKLYYSVDEETYNKLRAITGIKGVYTFTKSEVDRTYAWRYENMLTSALTSENQPKSEGSIESIIDSKTKKNETPKIVFSKNVLGELKEEKFILPEKNINVRLTTDKDIEDKIRNILKSEKYGKFQQIGVLLMEASTGKIRAMVQKDDREPNINLCSATENGYAPGSIFKAIVEEAAIEYKGIPISTKHLCAEDKKQHGYIDMEEAFIVSCNDYFKNLGNTIKFKNILPFAETQGLFSKVLNFHGNGEVSGDYTKESFSDTNLAIGQSMRITPIQAIGIVNTIINGGTYVKPYLVEAFVDGKDNIIEKLSTESHRAIKVNTANILKNQMIKVVRSPKGTANQAYISNIETGGKTGTTERVIRVKKDELDALGKAQYVDEKHSDGWFTGFYKNKDKYYSMVVFVKDIAVQGEEAGTTSVPIFKDIVEALSN
jgi:cell division protein FtsI/penicillin-binding protein 2